jgi:hypothetical protein
LHVCAKFCQYDAARIIIKHVEEQYGIGEVKKLVNSRTIEGHTSLHYAAEIEAKQTHFPGEDAQLMNLLIDSGGQVSIQTLNVSPKSKSFFYPFVPDKRNCNACVCTVG